MRRDVAGSAGDLKTRSARPPPRTPPLAQRRRRLRSAPMNFTHVGGHGIYFGAGPPPFARDDDDDDDDDARGRGFERVMSRIQLGAMNDGGARYVGQERRVDRPPKTETKLNRLVELYKWKELREDLVEKGVEMERWCGQPGRIVSAGAGIVFDAKVARARWVKNQKDAAKEAAKKALPGKPIAKAKEKKKQRAAEWDVDAVDLYDAILHPAAPADVLRGLIVLASDDVLKTRMKAANKKKRCMLHAAAQMRAPEVLSALLERVPKGDVTYRGALSFLTPVPTRPRRRGERRSLRTLLPGGVSLRPGSLAHDPDTPPSTPFNSASDAFELHPDIIARVDPRPSTLDPQTSRETRR